MGTDSNRAPAFVVIYCRTASVEEKKDAKISRQIEKCKKHVRQVLPGREIQFGVYADSGCSGHMPYKRENSSTEAYRSGLAALLKGIEQGSHKIVVVADLSRLATSKYLLEELQRDYFWKYGASLLVAREYRVRIQHGRKTDTTLHATPIRRITGNKACHGQRRPICGSTNSFL